LFTSAQFLSANGAHLLIGAILIIGMVTIPLMANTVLGADPLEGGLRLLRMTVAIPFGAVLGGILTQRIGIRFPAVTGLILTAAGFYMMSGWDLTIADPTMTIHLTIAGFGFGLLISPVTTAAMTPAIEGDRGAASSLTTVSRMLGMTFGLAAITAWGTDHFNTLVADAPAFTSDPAIQAEISRLASDAGLDVFQAFFSATAVLSLLALIPVWLMARAD
jgi:hypothetical protein